MYVEVVVALSKRVLQAMVQSTTQSAKGNDEWTTPKWLFDALNKIYDFKLDAAATRKNALCDTFYTKKENALKKHWCCRGGIRGATFLNPPYGKVVGAFVKKACEESKHTHGAHPRFPIVVLLPMRTETEWFKTVFESATFLVFLNRRLAFGHPFKKKYSAPFPSCLAIFDGRARAIVNDELWGLEQLGVVWIMPGSRLKASYLTRAA